jgi:hypothetical protein
VLHKIIRREGCSRSRQAEKHPAVEVVSLVRWIDAIGISLKKEVRNFSLTARLTSRSSPV